MIALALSSTLLAQDLGKVQKRFFPNPEGLEINTPLAHKKSGYTTLKEMNRFLNQKRNDFGSIVSFETIGKTQKNREIQLVMLSRQGGDTNKMKVMFIGRIHGDEPGGTEGLLHFIDQITTDSELQNLLDKVDFYILPMVNVDGGLKLARRTANGLDLNRDQVRMETPEAQSLRAVINRIDPHVVVDFHEYQPLKSAYSEISDNLLTVPWDVMFLTSGNPNVATPIRTTIDSLFLPRAYDVLTNKEFTTHTYFTPRKVAGGVQLNMGGSSPRSTSNAFALNNSYSILFEGRGIGLGRKTIKRRLFSAYLVAKSVAQTSFENKELLLANLDKAVAERSPVAVEFSATKLTDCPIAFINQFDNRLDTISMLVSDAMQSQVKLMRELPEKYYLLPTELGAIQMLHRMGIQTETLLKEQTEMVESYQIKSAREEKVGFATFTPLQVSAEVIAKQVTLPVGTVVIDTYQKRMPLLSVMLEPESSNGFVNYRIIETKEGDELPVYRSMKK